MGTVQRQSLMLLANDEYQSGNVDKAKGLLDLSQHFFPAPNFPIDVYAVYIVTGSTRVDVVDLYKKVYGIEKAQELWDAAFKYYNDELGYLATFRGDKAAGVRGTLQSDLQIMSLLSDVARRTMGDNERAAKADDVLGRFNS